MRMRTASTARRFGSGDGLCRLKHLACKSPIRRCSADGAFVSVGGWLEENFQRKLCVEGFAGSDGWVAEVGSKS
jgi:hypothetical protein